ncbi:MAG: hypothetical protein HC887_09455 [Desulfobacteraceae bacterium]|nr:hypothetical protein [Desulfobacteraceae bacterium]
MLAPITPYLEYIQWLERQDKQASQAYWTNYLNAYEHLATLPKKQGATGYILQKSTIKFDKEISSKLSLLASRNQVTLNTVFQTLWGMLLCRYNNTDDVVSGLRYPVVRLRFKVWSEWWGCLSIRFRFGFESNPINPSILCFGKCRKIILLRHYTIITRWLKFRQTAR